MIGVPICRHPAAGSNLFIASLLGWQFNCHPVARPSRLDWQSACHAKATSGAH
jgi:hypothetical protein